MVFAGSNYYPGAGVKDLRQSYDTLDEAKGFEKIESLYRWVGRDNAEEIDSTEYDWVLIFDTHTGDELCYDFNIRAYRALDKDEGTFSGELHSADATWNDAPGSVR